MADQPTTNGDQKPNGGDAPKPAPAQAATPAPAKPAPTPPKPAVAAKTAPAKTPTKAPTPAKTPTPKPKTAVVDAGGLLPQNAVNKMQQDAAGIPPAAKPKKDESLMEQSKAVAEVPAQPAVADIFDTTKFNRLFVNAMFTLSLGDIRMHGMKDALSAVTVDGVDHNLYSPFRKAAKPKAGELPGAEGVLREVLPLLLDATDKLNNNNVMFIGKPADAGVMLEGALNSIVTGIQGELPLAPDYLVFDLAGELGDDEDGEGEDDESDEDGGPIPLNDKPAVTDPTDQIMFRDIVDIRTWIAPDAASDVAEATHNAVINFVVNAGAFYDAKEPAKYLKNCESVLLLHAKARTVEVPTNLLLAVNIDSARLADPGVRELVDILLDEEGYTLYNRAALKASTPEETNWLPSTPEQVDAKLLSGDCDLLFVKLVNAPDDEDEGIAATAETA